MAIFKNWLASSQDLYFAFVVCSFPVYLWTYYRIFDQIPAWIIRMNVWELIGITSYALMFSLIESLILWFFFLFLARLLPENVYRSQFVVYTAVVMITSAVWAVIAQLNYPVVYNWEGMEGLPWLVAYIITILVGYLLVRRFSRLATFLYKFVRAISVLATLYIATGLVATVIVIIRNL